MAYHPRVRIRVALTSGLCLCASHFVCAAEGGMRVLHHQAVQITSHSELGPAEHVTFDAYGRRFELSVKPNERIRRAINTSTTTAMPLEGTVDGANASWVRVTRSSSGWRGIIYDGSDLYAVEPASDISGATVEPLAVSGSAPVVYRLSDALLPVEEMSCEIVQPDGTLSSPAPSTTAADAFSALSSELHIQAAASELVAMKQVRVGVVGDFEFVSLFKNTGTSVDDAIISRMNVVDGIFTSEIGVKISLAPSTLFTSSSDPFTKSKASDLLTELRTWRGNTKAQLASGLSHLMTGRDLDGDTVGIAYIGSVCDGSNASSLSEGRRSTTQSALIAAHEIGHNFGAPHDGENGACQSTPQTFLMAPRLNGSDQFSACSIAQIQPIVNTARCLTAYVPPDASLIIPNPTVSAVVGTSFVASFSIQASGDDASKDVSITATLPATLTIQSVTANGGSCTNGAGTATCTLGALPAGDTRQMDLTLTATEAGSLSIGLALDSSNDANAANDTGTITVAASSTTTTSPNPPAAGGSSNGGGGGGGGRIDLLLLVLLGALRFAPWFDSTNRGHHVRSKAFPRRRPLPERSRASSRSLHG
jgi:hypothetical protein